MADERAKIKESEVGNTDCHSDTSDEPIGYQSTLMSQMRASYHLRALIMPLVTLMDCLTLTDRGVALLFATIDSSKDRSIGFF